MQALDLNLASRPFRNNTLIWLGYGVAVVLLTAFSVWNVNAYRANGEQLTELRDKVSKINGRMQELARREQRARSAAGGFDLANLTVQTAKANDVIEWKAFSWTQLFNLLEQIQPYDVKMLSIRPVFYAAERRAVQDGIPEGAVPVRVQGIARDLLTFLELERSLLADPHFDRVEPEGNSLLKTGETQFELKFLYYPDKSATHEESELPPVIPSGTPVTFAQAEEEYKRKLERGDDAAADGETPAGAADASRQGDG